MNLPRAWVAVAFITLTTTLLGCATPNPSEQLENGNLAMLTFGEPKGVLGSVAQRGHMILEVLPTVQFAERFSDSGTIKISGYVRHSDHSAIEMDSKDLISRKKRLVLNFSISGKKCYEDNPESKLVFRILDQNNELEIATYVDPLGCSLTQSNLSFQ